MFKWFYITVFLLGSVAAYAQSLRIENAFVLPTPARTSAPLYLYVANPTSQSVMITGAAAPFTNRVVLRQHTKREGKEVIESSGTITIPANSRVKLLPDSTELVMLNLASPLQGDTV